MIAKLPPAPGYRGQVLSSLSTPLAIHLLLTPSFLIGRRLPFLLRLLLQSLLARASLSQSTTSLLHPAGELLPLLQSAFRFRLRPHFLSALDAGPNALDWRGVDHVVHWAGGERGWCRSVSSGRTAEGGARGPMAERDPTKFFGTLAQFQNTIFFKTPFFSRVVCIRRNKYYQIIPVSAYLPSSVINTSRDRRGGRGGREGVEEVE